MKFLLLTVVIMLITMTSFGQTNNGAVRGIIKDSVTLMPLSDATVSVLQLKDSSLVSFTLTSKGGSFEIHNLPFGDYKLIVSFEGLQTTSVPFSVSSNASNIDLKEIYLQPLYRTLDAVVITDDAPVKIKGDTLAFNAGAFKTKPNAVVEDLLKKLPGVQVDRNGTVIAQGEEVQKVFVDGKEFFGNDPKLATKNLTADMIDQVEIYDDMSEQSKFNKIDDGSRSKAINLKLKKDKKRGTFGKAYGGFGTNERYDAGINAFLFNAARQATVIAKANNVNAPGFTPKDMPGNSGGTAGAASDGRNSGGGVPRSTGSPINSTGGTLTNGITSSSQIGGNLKDVWGTNLEMTGSYLFSQVKTKNEEDIFRQTFGENANTYTSQNRLSQIRTSNHNLNFNLALFVDSFNSIVYIPTLRVQESNTSADDTTSIYTIDAPGQRQEINQSKQRIESESEGLNWNNNIVWRKRFRRPGRTLSVSVTNSIADNARGAYNQFMARVNSRNTFVNTLGKINNYSSGFSYTEPISRNKMVEVNYNFSRNQSESDRRTSLFNNLTGKYDITDVRQTNNFENTAQMHRIGANYRFFERSYSYQIGFSMQQTALEGNNISKRSVSKQSFVNLFPVALFNYQLNRSKSLRIAYRGNTRQPSTTQLQDVLDETAAPNYYRGNPQLSQEFSNDIRITYNLFNLPKMQNMFAVLTLGNTYDQIATSIRDTAGGQITVPVNLSGQYIIAGNFNLGFPIKKLEGSNFNSTTRTYYNQQPVLVNGEKIFTRNFSIGEDLRLNYNYKEKLDLWITASLNYNSVAYSTKIKSAQNESYFTHTYSADISYLFSKNLVLNTDFDYTINSGRTAGFNQSFSLWNANLTRQFLKNNRAEIKISVFDILNQNIRVNRNIGAGYLEDVRSLTLRRYFLLTFSYNIKRLGGKVVPGVKT